MKRIMNGNELAINLHKVEKLFHISKYCRYNKEE